jgi:hypothetical protein
VLLTVVCPLRPVVKRAVTLPSSWRSLLTGRSTLESEAAGVLQTLSAGRFTIRVLPDCSPTVLPRSCSPSTTVPDRNEEGGSATADGDEPETAGLLAAGVGKTTVVRLMEVELPLAAPPVAAPHPERKGTITANNDMKATA